MGAKIILSNERLSNNEKVCDIEVRSSELNGCEFGPEMADLMIDEYPILAIAASFANTPSKLRGLNESSDSFKNAKRIIIVACGTSWIAGLVAEYIIESIARLPVEVEYASEFRYRNPIIYKDDIVIAFSQSVETADTLSALKLAKKRGAMLYGICTQ